jgi:hypothetical protein
LKSSFLILKEGSVKMNNGDLKIDVVNSKADLKEFLALPWYIYKDNSYWVPPLLQEVKELIDTKKNPFWEHAQRELFLARREGKVVGRIVAIVDNNHNNFHQEKTGFFGFFECVNDYEVAKCLFDNAKEWCMKNDMKILRGPMSPSMNDECAFLLEGFDSPPVVMMPYSPPYYLELSERYGFQKGKDLYAFIFYSKDGIPERITKLVERVKRKTGVGVRIFDKKNFERDVQILKDIYNDAWEKNWGFVPMTEKEMDLTAEKLKEFFEPELVLFAEMNGEPVGVSVIVPDVNQLLKKLNGRLGPIGVIKALYYKRKINGARAIIFGFKKEYRNFGLNAVLFHDSVKKGIELGYKWCELSWNLEDNDLINSFDSAAGGKLYKKYRIYEMPI